jgi:hypothetical protein
MWWMSTFSAEKTEKSISLPLMKLRHLALRLKAITPLNVTKSQNHELNAPAKGLSHN